jgi:hypothetical protein
MPTNGARFCTKCRTNMTSLRSVKEQLWSDATMGGGTLERRRLDGAGQVSENSNIESAFIIKYFFSTSSLFMDASPVLLR